MITNPVNASLARRIAVVGMARELSYNEQFSEDSFRRYLIYCRRGSKLRAALCARLTGRPFVMDSAGSRIHYLGTSTNPTK